ncbi:MULTISPECIES: UDP-glucose 4-epimerase GalE [Marinilactibacillus]|uniref:UDP-glucose 4-epimerase n=1 Tax=Marinilactibacillus piezotolerans TaxID=258723 RepID=A0A1I3Z0N6_9LACT|nr:MULTISPECIES: UDP-glucose 4-epimerase GalE [Marinilactibacillus]API89876.1 UDP-glucose 4-epimerase GalE [Marinilactibacillus sp. 15R]SFK37674.1 UDP-galactose 4-epimerase [Marinilactibacillus piezotolerans]
MAILVTGGAGYIGSHTVIELLNEGREVVIVDDYSNSKPEVLNRIKELSGKDFVFHEVDITDKDALKEVFKQHDLEAVIHFAGYKAVGESVAKPLMYYRNNLNGTIALMELMNEFDVKNMVFSSSATVYGMNNEAPFTEDMPLSTTNPYGTTKLFIEQFIQDQVAADPSWSAALLRYFNPIGAHESGRIGEDPNDIPNNLMPYITQVAVGKLEKLSVYGDDYDTPDGTGVRDYIHVVDLAKGHIKALESVLETRGVEAYNLGTGVGYSVLDVVKAFEAANNVEIPYQIVDRRPGDIGTSYADATKAHKVLEWAAELGIEDMCRDSWNWQKSNPNGYA